MERTIFAPDGMRIVVSDYNGMLNACCLGGCNNEKILYPLNERADGKRRGGCLICFPYFGPAPHDPQLIYYHGGRQHGLMRDTVPSDIMIFENIVRVYGKHFISEHRCDLEFWYAMDYELRRNLIMTCLSVHPLCIRAWNRSGVYVRPAFHPYFPNEGKTRLSINDVVYDTFTQHAQYVMINRDDKILIDTGQIVLRMILIGFPAKNEICLWSDDPSRYFCVEPIFGTEFYEILIGESFGMSMILEVITVW